MRKVLEIDIKTPNFQNFILCACDPMFHVALRTGIAFIGVAQKKFSRGFKFQTEELKENFQLILLFVHNSACFSIVLFGYESHERTPKRTHNLWKLTQVKNTQ